jgi:hypothetical protein
MMRGMEELLTWSLKPDFVRPAEGFWEYFEVVGCGRSDYL